jgi:hypothetical protein
MRYHTQVTNFYSRKIIDVRELILLLGRRCLPNSHCGPLLHTVQQVLFTVHVNIIAAVSEAITFSM